MSTKAETVADPQSCLNRAADDEPIFVLRAHDPLAADTVRRWVNSRRLVRGQWDETASEALQVAEEMDSWRLDRGR